MQPLFDENALPVRRRSVGPQNKVVELVEIALS